MNRCEQLRDDLACAMGRVVWASVVLVWWAQSAIEGRSVFVWKGQGR